MVPCITQAAEVASHSISDERTVESIRNTIIMVAESPEAVKSVTTLVKSVLAEQETRDAFSNLMYQVMTTPWMQEVGTYYFMSVLNDEQVTKWMNEQAARVVTETCNDPHVQKSTGDHVSEHGPCLRSRLWLWFCQIRTAFFRVDVI